jgi:hypothetical protein
METSHAAGGINFKHLKLTAGAADTTCTYTFAAPFPALLGAATAVKTTGTQGGVGFAYNEGTGVVTIGPVANNDVIRVTLLY